MKLTSFSVQGFRGLVDANHDLAPTGVPQARLLVTGPSGAGLTSFLGALVATAASLSTEAAAPAAATVVRRGLASATLRSTWWLDEAERRYAGLADGNTRAEIVFRLSGLGRVDADPGLLGVMSRYDHSGERSKVVYLPERRVSSETFTALNDFAAEQRRLQFSSEPSKLGGLARAILQDARRDGRDGLFERVQSLFNAMCKTAKLSRIKDGCERSEERRVGKECA